MAAVQGTEDSCEWNCFEGLFGYQSLHTMLHSLTDMQIINSLLLLWGNIVKINLKHMGLSMKRDFLILTKIFEIFTADLLTAVFLC